MNAETQANRARQLATTALKGVKSALSFGHSTESSTPVPDTSRNLSRRTFLRAAAGAVAGSILLSGSARAQEDTDMEAADLEPVRQQPSPKPKPGGPPPRPKPQGEPNYEGPNPPETSEQVDVGPRGSSGELSAPAISLETPSVTNINMNSPEDTEKPEYTAAEQEKPKRYLQDTLEAMYKTDNPVLRSYANLLAEREKKHNYRDEGIPNGRWVIHAMYYFDASMEPNYPFPYAPTIGTVTNFPDHVAQGIAMNERFMLDKNSNMGNAQSTVLYAPNSTASMFSLIWVLEHNTASAREVAALLTHPDPSKRKTPQEIKDYFLDTSSPIAHPDNLRFASYALNKTMKAYEQSKADMELAGIPDSNYTKNTYPKWKPIDQMPEGPEKQQALTKLAKELYFATKS